MNTYVQLKGVANEIKFVAIVAFAIKSCQVHRTVYAKRNMYMYMYIGRPKLYVVYIYCGVLARMHAHDLL